MIFRAVDRVESVTPKSRGGQGEARGRHYFSENNRPQGSLLEALAEMTLPPGSAIGFHRHPDNEESYLIVRGQGVFTDNGSGQSPVGPGDLCLIRRGESHCIANTGAEDLVFIAIIVKA